MLKEQKNIIFYWEININCHLINTKNFGFDFTNPEFDRTVKISRIRNPSCYTDTMAILSKLSLTHKLIEWISVLIMLGNLWVFDFWTNYAGIGPFSSFGSNCILPMERKDTCGFVCQWRLEKLLTSDYIRFLRSKGYIWFHSLTHAQFLCYYKSNVHPIIFYI